MFQSSGFFKGIICPYLASGLCERPYCHYKHPDLTRTEDTKTAAITATGSGLTYVPTPSGLENGPVAELVSNSATEFPQPQTHHMPSMLNMIGGAINKMHLRGCGDGVVSYKPTPKINARSSTYTTGSVQQTKTVSSEYTPTPLHLLKANKPKVNDLEYDPVVNYSTKMRPLTCVRVTLADAERESVKRPVEATGDEMVGVKKQKIADDVCEVEAKFSDDEEDVECKKIAQTISNSLDFGSKENELVSSKNSSVSNVQSVESDGVGASTAVSASRLSDQRTLTDSKADKVLSGDNGDFVLSTAVSDKVLSSNTGDKLSNGEKQEAVVTAVECKDVTDKDRKAKELIHHSRSSSKNKDESEGKKEQTGCEKHSGLTKSKNGDVSHHHHHSSSSRHHHNSSLHTSKDKSKSHSGNDKEHDKVSHENSKHSLRKDHKPKEDVDHPKDPSRSKEHDHSVDRDHLKERSHSKEHDHSKDRDNPKDHSHSKELGQSKDRVHSKDQSHSKEHGHSRDRDHSKDHSHSKEHDNSKDRDRTKDHSHSKEHDHSKDRDRTKDHSHSKEHSLSRDRDHSKDLVKLSDSRESSGKEKDRKLNGDTKSRSIRRSSGSTEQKSDTTNTQNVNHDKSESGNQVQDGQSLSGGENASICRDSVTMPILEDRLSNGSRHRSVSRSVSEYGARTDKRSGKTSAEEATKKPKLQQGGGYGTNETSLGSLSSGEFSVSNKLHSSSREKLRIDSKLHVAKLSESRSPDVKSRNLLSSLSRSKDGSKLARTMKRAISQVELFGEDSDTEVDVNDRKKSSAPIVLARRKPSKLQKSSREADSDGSDNLFDVGDLLLDSSEESEMSRFEECHRLFLEDSKKYDRRAAVQPAVKDAKNVAESVVDEPPAGKKRVAHASVTDQNVRRLLPCPKRLQPSAARTMLDRYRELQQRAEEIKKASAQVPVAAESSAPKVQSSTSIDSTASLKIKQRVAHTPKTGDFLTKPIVAVDNFSKIPVKVRQVCLDKIYHECTNIYDVADDAKQRAIAEEKSICEKSATKSIYLNLISNAVRRLRDESPFNKSLSPKNPKALSHEAILGGSKAANTSFTLNRLGRPPPLLENISGAELYKRLQTYIMSESQLTDNSFPRPNPNNKNEVLIKRSERDLQKPQSADPNQKFCCRCGKAFSTFSNGDFVREEECIYHYSQAWKQRVGGSFDNLYSCCGGNLSSPGCQVSKCHVHDGNKYRCLTGYMATIPTSPRDDGNYGVYALDCEMVYTKLGCELARITVIGPKLELVLDKIVKPDHEVLDYNTRFSGLTADDLKDVKTSLRDVQAILLHLFNSQTILIGHSLESDLTALKLVHGTVVDTSIVFPHRRGPPFKRALQNVVKETLLKIIQNSIGGHDSTEDARSCMELMLWKVKEDAKRSLR